MNRSEFAMAVHGSLPQRPTRHTPETGIRRWDEFGSAETIAAELFRRNFEQRHPGSPVLFTSQHEYRFTRMAGSPGIEFLLNMMKEHFRNWVSPRNAAREGGFRKPDGMGIAARGRRTYAELLEVKPVRNEADGRPQMEDMLRRLRSGMDEVLKRRSGPAGFGADDFTFEATEWRPRPEEMVCPLLNPAGSQSLTWACFDAMRARARVDGVVLYELHELTFAGADKIAWSIPTAVADRIRSAWEGAEPDQPWQERYCAANRGDVQTLRAVAQSSGYAALAAGLSLLLNRSSKAEKEAAATGRHRTLLESSKPLMVQVGGSTVVEPAILEGILLADAVRRLG